MFCSECGAELPAEALYCPYCGVKLTIGGAAPSAPAPAVPEEAPVCSIDITVTDQQIRRGESIVLRDACLAAPLSLRLKEGMQDGSRLRLRNARVSDAYGGGNRPIDVRVHVHPLPEAPAAPAPSVPPVPAPERRAPAPSFAPVSQRCQFQLYAPNQSNSSTEGTVDIQPDRLILYKKSTVTRIAFGAIGSAIEGKGKHFAEIPRTEVLSCEKKLTKKGKLWRYEFRLSNARMLYLGLSGLSIDAAESALDRFIAQ